MLPTTRIYADFNGLVGGPRNLKREAVVLDTFGTARDLANAGIILSEGLPLIAVDWSDDEEDLEGYGTAQYDFVYKWWVVEFDEIGVRYVPAGDRTPVREFRCVGCRVDISEHLELHRDPGGGCAIMREGNNGLPVAVPCCPHCRTPIDEPMRPPTSMEDKKPG
jgi:hypothetical protein